MKLIKEKKKIDVKFCNNLFDRFKGFMLKKEINNCLIFPKCNSIHTFFMLKNIDVIMTDKNYIILYIYKNLSPWKVIFPKKHVYYTIELKTNTFEFKINEKLKIE